MTRVKSPRKTKKRTLLSANKGYKKSAHNNFWVAHQRYLKAQVFAFRDRHNKKRTFRNLWILRLNSILRNSFGINYSTCTNLLKRSKIIINRKVLSQLAVFDWSALKYLVFCFAEFF